MDWELIYDWLEQKSGVSYDLNEDIDSIKGKAFTETYYWQMRINMILDDLEAAIEVVDENWRELTPEMPSRDKLKEGLEKDCIRKLANEINTVKSMLGMSQTPIKDEEDVLENALPLAEMISICTSFSFEEIQKRKWFEEYDEESEGALTEVLELHKNDLADIYQTIEGIRESYAEDTDDEDEDMDMDMDEDE